jgi:hypothetical protein
MKKIILCVPDEMVVLVKQWKKWIPEMTIIQEETCDDQPKRVKEKRDKEVKPDPHPDMYMSDAERFVTRVVHIFNKVESLNGQRITTSARGHESSYTFFVNVDGIIKALNDLFNNHKAKIEDYLRDKQSSESMTVVCPLVGFILNSHLMNSSNIQLSDIAFALEDFYGKSTAVNYLSRKLRSQEAEVLFNTLLGLLKKYKNV